MNKRTLTHFILNLLVIIGIFVSFVLGYLTLFEAALLNMVFYLTIQAERYVNLYQTKVFPEEITKEVVRRLKGG